MYIIYRFSDATNVAGSNPTRPANFCKRKLLKNFFKIFNGHEIHIIADKASPTSLEWLSQFPSVEVTNLGSGDATFLYSLQKALSVCKPNDKAYFVEDDYIHLPGSPEYIESGLDIADYVTLYDHPDKYKNGYNPFIQHEGEVTLIRQTPDGMHWKYTNSTTETFAANISSLARDIDYFSEPLTHAKSLHAQGKSPDFILWCNLLQSGAKLVSSIPGYASHLHIPWVTVNPVLTRYLREVLEQDES
jgi:hypothetical protein